MKTATNMLIFIAFIGLAMSGGCVQDSADWLCPSVEAGELVITEIRGSQGGDDDTSGEWIELYNATEKTLDLQGLRLEVQRLDGSANAIILVRESVPINPRSYSVVGRFENAARPFHIDYGYALDFDTSIYTTATVRILACGELIDATVYRGLPNPGTRALIPVDGAEPSANLNDFEDAWCDDGSNDGNGTAGMENKCELPTE